MRFLFWVLGLMGLIVLFPSVFSICQGPGDIQCGSIPTNGCDANVNVTFTPGTYNLPNGIDVCLDNIIVNCNGATLVGQGDNSIGITVHKSNVTIENCNLREYYTEGIRVQNVNAQSPIIRDNSIKANFPGGSKPGISVWTNNATITGNEVLSTNPQFVNNYTISLGFPGGGGDCY